MAEFTVTILGSGSAVPMHGRHPSAQVIQYVDDFYLVDCGEGTQLLFREAGVKPFRIGHILISHLHGDHVFGLPGLLSSYSHLGRSEPLTVFGPTGIKGLLNAIIDFTQLKINYPLEIIEIETSGLQLIRETDDLEVFSFPLHHRILCQGYLFREKKTSIRVNKDTLLKYSLTAHQIMEAMQGRAIYKGDELISKEELFLPPYPLQSYAYCSDTAYSSNLPGWLNGTGVIYHEATFKNDLEGLAKETGHSTAGQAGLIAREAGASALILGHYSSRYKSLAELLAEAKVNFENTVLSEEGKKYRIRDLMGGK